MPRRYLLIFVLLIAIVGGLTVWWNLIRPRSPLDAIRQAAVEQRFSDVIALSHSLLNGPSPVSTEVSLLAGLAHSRLGHYEESLRAYEFIPDDGSPEAVEARWESAEILRQWIHRPSDAAAQLTRLLSQDPRHGPARVQLAAFFGFCGRTWEANALRFALIRDGLGTPRELVLLGLDDLSVENLDRLEQFRKSAPNDTFTQLAEAYSELRDLRFAAAEQQYRKIVERTPDLAEAQVRYGALLVRRQAKDEFLQWHARLPSGVDHHPDLWEIRGDFARMQNDVPGAERCYWECLRRSSCHRRASHRLGLLLQQRNETEAAAKFLRAAAQLLDVQVAAKRFHVLSERERALDAARLCASAGLEWEAWGWSQVDRELLGSAQPYQRPAGTMPRMNPATDPAQIVDLTDRAIPAWVTDRSLPRAPTPIQIEPGSVRPEISFADASFKTEFQFAFYSGDDPKTPEQLSFQFTGGGVAVLDYDGDHWPDTFLTQGSDWPEPSQTRRGDSLFRNQSGLFSDIAKLAGVDDAGYGQGSTVGDFDNDGFPDLFVANLEGGRLYRNNGDGTFQDNTSESGIEARRWTTSCLLADVNADGNPDLYLVNYLEGNNLYRTICRRPDGSPRGCTPYDFDPAQDALWINAGNGRFEDVTKFAGIEHPGGNGLGIVAIRDDQTRRLNVFVANDTTANFWFVNRPQMPGSFQFHEESLISGLAFDRDGRAQACMGIAAGDADGDGRIDLFTTNFYDESNTLYLQRDGGLFDDATAQSGLRESSLKLLGFGTQFLDADLDGWLDLVVTNGHVDSVATDLVPSAMRPQFFRNLGEAHFIEAEPQAIGSWFGYERRGRGLARLDWNRDGREEFVVSHLDSAASILENVSHATGNSLAFHLIGTSASRDAIGATVRVTCNSRVLMRQLSAGDGYQASNQRQLVFGLGGNTVADQVEVEWPSGQTQTYYDVPVGAEILLIEGEEHLIILRH